MSSPPSAPPAVPSTKPTGRFQKWHRVTLSVCFIAFAGELGLCLIVLPWLSNWDMSYIPIHSQRWSDTWMSPYFRGTLSGLGLLNLYVALAETAKIFRSFFGKP